MADNSVEEGCGSGKGSITDRSTVGGEADKLFAQFSDGFVSCCVLVHILGLANFKEYAERFQGFVGSQTGKS